MLYVYASHTWVQRLLVLASNDAEAIARLSLHLSNNPRYGELRDWTLFQKIVNTVENVWMVSPW